MSDDLIRRSDAIEAIEEVDWWHQNRYGTMVSGANSAEHQAWYKAEDIYNALEAVPSADRKTEPQTADCPFDDKIPCEWVCTEYGNCKYKPKDEPQERSEHDDIL